MTFEQIRVALRTLRTQPVFATVVILSLALAISLNTTMYAVLDALIHPRVDIRDPASLYRVKYYGDFAGKMPSDRKDSLLLTAPSIEAVAWFSGPTFANPRLMRSGEHFAEGPVAKISREYFELMSPRMVSGRIFLHDDETAASQPIVLGEALATRLFAPGATPLGGRVFVDSVPYVVVGVLSRYADFPQQHSGFVSFNSNPSGGWILGKAGPREMFTRVLRVRSGVTRERLERDLAIVAERIALATGESPRETAFRVGGTTPEQLQIEGVHLALIMAVVAVLLVACANVANMQLARGIGRSRELALRAALGADRRRLIEHLLIESVVLATVGLVLGILLTYWFGIALRASVPPAVGRYIVEPNFSWRVLLFAVAATIACIVMVGLVPAIRVSSVDPNTMLKGNAGTGATRRSRRQYSFLVVVEIGLALALLCACGVAIQSALRTSGAVRREGYDPTPLAMGYVMSPVSHGERKPLSEVFASVIDRMRAIEGVASAATFVSVSFENAGIVFADSNGVRALPTPGYSYRTVSPNYFRTMGIPIIMGRDFQDGERDVPGAIVDEYTAKKYWPNANPVGAMIKFGDAASTRPFVRIVGVTGRYDENGEVAPINMADQTGATLGAIYLLASERDTLDRGMGSPMMVITRTAGDATALATAMRRAGVFRAQAMLDVLGIRAARATQDFMATLFSLFAGLAIALGLFGVYGVVAHSVAERRRELGVRIALGATPRDILHAVLRETVVVGLSGIAFGLALVYAFIHPVQAVAYAGDIYDSVLFGAIAFGVFAAAGVSAYIPARRATLVDPTESLRSE